MPSINNEYIETISIDQESFYNITAAKTVQGKHFSWAHFSPDYIRELGKSIGKFHKISVNYDKGQPEISNFYQRRNFVQKVAKEELSPLEYQKIKNLYSAIEALRKPVGGFGLIHNDLIPGNYIIDNTKKEGITVTLIDLKDCAYSYHLYDIALLFLNLRKYNNVSIFLKLLNFPANKFKIFNIWKKSFFEYFLEGYYGVLSESYLPFSELKRQIKLFQKLHKILKIPKFQKNNYPK